MPDLRKWASQERSLPGAGAVNFCPSMVTAGWRAGSSGQPPEPISRVKAVTLDVVTFTAESPAISASTRARSQCLSERIDGQPLHAVVGQRPGGEPDLARVGIAAAFGDLVEDAVDLDFGIGMVAVRRLRAGDAHQAHAFGGHGALHHVAGLLLRVDLAVVFHGGDVV